MEPGIGFGTCYANTHSNTHTSRQVMSPLFLIFLIYTALFTVQIVSKQLHSDNMKIIQQSLFL